MVKLVFTKMKQKISNFYLFLVIFFLTDSVYISFLLLLPLKYSACALSVWMRNRNSLLSIHFQLSNRLLISWWPKTFPIAFYYLWFQCCISYYYSIIWMMTREANTVLRSRDYSLLGVFKQSGHLLDPLLSTMQDEHSSEEKLWMTQRVLQ